MIHGLTASDAAAHSHAGKLSLSGIRPCAESLGTRGMQWIAAQGADELLLQVGEWADHALAAP